ncbi:protein DpdE [Rhodococcus erythropolis]
MSHSDGKSMNHLHVGAFVDFKNSPGIGKVASMNGTVAHVSFFDSVARPVAETVRASECSRVNVAPETRAFWRDPDTHRWRACRIKANSGSTYYVQFPNTEYDSAVQEEDLHVRWDRPVADPVDVLVTGGNESAFYYNSRIPFLRNIIAQEAASSGISALLSSATELYPHQVKTALTVLSDPVQRYLLADEVGLGKTIEAGYIIRQTLLDEPTASVTILAPGTLRSQWLEELATKFFTDDFPGARIRISSHDTPEKWIDYHGSDLVVVDEAHRIALTEDPKTSPYKELAELAHSSEKLLLLSATPANTHWRAQLGILHLLDRELYSWNRTDDFERKYVVRAELADSVYQLDSEYPLYIRDAIADISNLVPNDPRIQELGTLILAQLDEYDDVRESVDPVDFSTSVEALRAHISETYRIHRRVIRNRRPIVLRASSKSDLLPYEVRGRANPDPLLLPEGDDSVQEALVLWQARVAQHLIDNNNESKAPAYATILAILAARAHGPVNDLLDSLRWRLDHDETSAQRAGLSPSERHALTAVPVLEFEYSLTVRLATFDTADAAIEGTNSILTAVLPVLKNSRNVVLFCGPGSMAQVLHVRISQRFPKALAVLNHSSMPDRITHEALAAWKEHDASSGRGIVLITDIAGEDGLNLQKADAAVHVRLPWSPNQLEQRLGRIDRYPGHEPGAPRTPARNYVLLESEGSESFSSDWFELLRDGYRIFENSISSMQSVIAHSLPSIWVPTLLSGPATLHLQAEKVRESLTAERKEVEKFDMLESIDDVSLDAAETMHRLDEVEADWRAARSAVNGYVGTSDGGMKIRISEFERRGCPQVAFDLLGSHPLVSPRLYRRAMVAISSAATQGTFNRNAGLRSPGIRMLRAGNPVIDLFGQICRIDDRGQAYAFERSASTPDGEPRAFSNST